MRRSAGPFQADDDHFYFMFILDDDRVIGNGNENGDCGQRDRWNRKIFVVYIREII